MTPTCAPLWLQILSACSIGLGILSVSGAIVYTTLRNRR
jgi:hypothetical protein